MAYRVFKSPDGSVWHAWDVPGVDAASLVPATARAEAMKHGWLCFEGERGKRRLAPIPPRWADRSEAELWLYCRVADPVGPEGSTPPRAPSTPTVPGADGARARSAPKAVPGDPA